MTPARPRLLLVIVLYISCCLPNHPPRAPSSWPTPRVSPWGWSGCSFAWFDENTTAGGGSGRNRSKDNTKEEDEKEEKQANDRDNANKIILVNWGIRLPGGWWAAAAARHDILHSLSAFSLLREFRWGRVSRPYFSNVAECA